MTQQIAPYSPHIGFISLGCPKATVDSERILTRLRAEGYIIAPNYASADLVIINTCGFIDEAIEESLATIAEALEENGQVIITGCLGARADFIRAHYPEVLAITSAHAYDEVIAAVHQHLIPPERPPFAQVLPPQGVKLTPPHYAYIKIAEGCDHHCCFCIIPSLRGRQVSRSLPDIMTEAENLIAAGVHELLIIAQDTTAYGRDLKHQLDFWHSRPLRTDLATLAQQLGMLPAWVRLHYLYPYPQLDQLVTLMGEGVIVPYLDLPLQHASPTVLRAMRRPAATEQLLTRLDHWRQLCPDLTVRSTFIVGFPGETDEDFNQLIEFLSVAQLDRVGAFTYSAVEGAAANQLPNPVPDDIKQARLAHLMTTQAEISRIKLTQKIGQKITVLVDEVNDEQCIARSTADAPEIDGTVIIPGAWELEPGDFIEVIVTDSSEYDLTAEPVCD
ncbi:30S ribosomal protein S12 methylthiotransferase RimO [Rhodoferax sp. 4810]|uniref:Ribosomal protein uS12 methylthiotransferase RimO n=1 Tax=Thiospirillum jenense TaxID=1653858 RepID=A0A839HFS5_9GAMM|nr:30S ribosomal protein S12 methylthiotransferase RimO [Thiospirillum jenense]MBB1073943.1 30S ribosomal protein S12 methylthiotransferase RimO [Rhodoferax jenense]MBB1125819.1 30S ribosomal protein S12 methylthiotransferase RimO [Thiospirillum jenense]